MSRSGLTSSSMEGHVDMSHLQVPKLIGAPQQDDPSDLEELEQFAKAFKQRRIKLGFTQVQTEDHRLKIQYSFICIFAVLFFP